ncbi:MAG TPA: hypothetical protein VIV11_40760 [Kofleriaceae bacterium]
MDLDVDFGAARPDVVDHVLAACAEPRPSAALLDGLPISVRVRALLRLAAVESPTAELVVRCTCGESLEIELPLERIADDPDEIAGDVRVAGRRLRVPTARDQRMFAHATTRLALASTLLAEGPPLEPDLVPDIERALADADPLVEFFVTTTCPSCGVTIRSDVDLEALALARLAHLQGVLVVAIHRLASAYHWSESDVLALPGWRRQRYLDLIRGEA